MLGAAQIREMQRQAAVHAAREKQVPLTIYPEDMENIQDVVREIPFIGDYLPTGWERVSLRNEDGSRGVYMGDNEGYGAYFVDSSGFGSPYEPALTLEEFCARVRPGRAYAIVEAGEFQVKIGVFRRVWRERNGNSNGSGTLAHFVGGQH